MYNVDGSKGNVSLLMKWIGREREEKEKTEWIPIEKEQWENQRIFIEHCMKVDSIKQKTARLFLDRFRTCFLWIKQKKAKQKN